MNITTQQSDERISVYVEGKLKTTEVAEFEEKAFAALSESKTGIDLYLDNLDYISSSGLRVLLKLYKNGAAEEKTVTIAAESDFIREILNESGFGNFFHLSKADETPYEPLDFHPVAFDDHERYMEYYRKCMIACAETSFMTIWTESVTYDIRQAFSDGFYWQQMNWDDERVWLPPVGDWDSVEDWESLLKRRVPAGAVFSFVPAYLLRKWNAFSEHIEVEEQRSEWDYVYSIPKLMEGKGQALKNWRKDIKTFEEDYPDHSTEPITEDNLDELKAFQKQWMLENAGKEKMTEELMMEDRSTRFMLDNWSKLPNVVGRILRVEGKLVAYIVVEKLDDNMLSGQYLKADYNYKGCSRFLKHELYASLLPEYILVNAWGDSDLPGLRLAKESEDPIVLYKKYRVTWKG